MKTRLTFLALIVAATILSFFSCKENDVIKRSFRADFYTDLAGFGPSAECEEMLLNTQQGVGTATLVGGFTTELTFCVDTSTFAYFDATGSFVDELGDELFVTIEEGQILPSPDPDYLFYFADPFKIVGGTGRFAGASGGGTTDSYVDLDGIRTNHVWKGKILLRK